MDIEKICNEVLDELNPCYDIEMSLKNSFITVIKYLNQFPENLSVRSKNNIPEVTLDEIYQYISDYYDLDIKKLNLIKDKEKEMELHFCNKRDLGYELYLLAKQLKKRVIVTSDIYLPRDVIEAILKKNKY